MQNYNQSQAIPICDTWGTEKDAGYWNIDLEFNFDNKSIRDHNYWYYTSTKKTIEAFSSLLKPYRVYFNPNSKIEEKVKKVRIDRQPDELYDEFLENVYQTIKEYSIDINSITMEFDFFVYVRTEKSFPEVIRTWIREFGQSIKLGNLTIYLNLEDRDPYACFNIEHTLFYPFSYPTGEDNKELFELNRPLLEEALKNWEQKFNSEIEADGLPGIYEYGFLPEDQW